MNLVEKFNVSYNQSKGDHFVLEMFQASSYGSNSFCYDKVAQFQANDSAVAAPAAHAKLRNG